MLLDFTKETAVVAVAGVGAALATLAWLRKRDAHGPLPPGPIGYPLIGSLLAYPTHQEWLTFTRWRALYGDLVYANVAGQPIMVLNSPAVAHALLDERGATYSDRPHLHFADDVVGWKDSPIMCTASHPWFKPSRRLMHNAVGSRAALDGYIHMEEHEVHRFLRRVIDEPERVAYHLRKLAGSVILRILYGYDVKPGDDEYVNLAERVNYDLNRACTPGNFLVDFFPSLEFVPHWFPGTNWMRIAERMRDALHTALTKPTAFVREQLSAGTAHPSFVSSELSRPDWNEGEEGKTLAWAAQALYAGAADTTVSITYSFFLCMTLFPDVQRKAQEEINRVLGPHTLPTWADRDRLPYVDAVVKEILRWCPVAPQALPHCANADGTYGGYFIPKGTILIPNIWGYMHDPAVYPEPDKFNPDRYLSLEPKTDPRQYVFGFGRRVCPGKQLGEVSLWLVASNAIASLHITKKLGNDGLPITPRVEYTGAAAVFPSEFKCDIKPRSTSSEALIRSVHDAPYGL
ncbi:cytochrome P450 [Auricularia subglabra TFB-10046 SS5]|nr:cytochrome P450 [Auricularia subglabra TFB-10046 SS5]